MSFYVELKNILRLFMMKTIDLTVSLGSSMISNYLMKFVSSKFRCWKVRCPSKGQPTCCSRQIFLLKLSRKEQKTQLITSYITELNFLLIAKKKKKKDFCYDNLDILRCRNLLYNIVNLNRHK